MTPRQLHLLKPGDKVEGKNDSADQVVEGVVVYLEKDRQTVDAVKVGGTMYQREEMLACFLVVKEKQP